VSGGVTPCILNPGTRRRVVWFHNLVHLCLECTGKEAGWVPELVWTWCQGEKYLFYTPAGNWTPAVQPLALSLLKELCQLLTYVHSNFKRHF